jgi:hypothetical protein
VKKSTKAALLSAFVFPGLGHIYLKKHTAGALLAGASFAAIYYLVSNVVERAFEISENIQSGDLQLDIEEITKIVVQQSTGTDIQLLNIATTALIICWLIGIIDSYRVGCIRDKNDEVLVNR